MKPVIQTIIDKNGAEEIRFNPTAQMVLYSIHRGKNPGMSTSEVCALAGINPGLPGKWSAKFGSYFTNWLEEAIDFHVDDDAAVLERVGMIHAAQGNYNFWKDMARTKGVIKEEAPKRSLTINTDFSQVLIAVGGDFNAARSRLLSAHRGVADAGEPGLVSAPSSNGSGVGSGAGNRAGELQKRSMEIPDALDTDGGRAEQREPVPALSEQAPLTGSYEDLAD